MGLESVATRADHLARTLQVHGRIVPRPSWSPNSTRSRVDQARAAAQAALSGGERWRRRGKLKAAAWRLTPIGASQPLAPVGASQLLTPVGASQLLTLVTEPWDDYGLVDSGHGRKLERFGRFRFIRPEPQAMWAPASLNGRPTAISSPRPTRMAAASGICRAMCRAAAGT
jgi:hypothetical protein